MKDMAEALHVSSAYLSAIERGKKAPSEKVLSGLKLHYSLSPKEAHEVEEAAALSQTTVSIDLHGSDEEERMLAVSFARKFKGLEDFQKDQLVKLLNGE
mgnify:CR=1 FL=1